ncbi:heparinase II/III-like protein [Aquimarina sp. MAR_2010_214]|uniref:alginate lyase family protein n=1 Tax=Aquimarina sp. MAR_2010_214 TaxID=1250026 RepID=UPI000C70D12A|nr:alginate lyase family protein [Aquimarina sp. MAR_2010_214]PKV48790.1 heparinase II/III-like protein [Aquimarina sp. MAR_2010_214]
MDRSKLVLLIHTVKHLKFKQVYYQVFYKVRNTFFKKDYAKKLVKEIEPLKWNDSFFYQNSYSKESAFTFLNITHKFEGEIDWNYQEFGKLWTYNLNYFDFLNQEEINVSEGLKLIENYLKNEENLKDGKEPYPISLRGINWIKFLSKNNISDADIDQVLYNHYQTLTHNLEYHLLGNHLLENGYSLLFGAFYFKDEVLYKIAKQILTKELSEQILSDGAHFELSPMYHQILLHRLLDCINLVKNNPWKEDTLIVFLEEKVTVMLSWLQGVTYRNGNIPMVNDSAYDIAPSSDQLFTYGSYLGLQWGEIKVSESGYRMFRKDSYELFVDVGQIGPKYQPGHAHSDTFNFELYVKDKPVIVDLGTSTYEKNQLRLQERQTASHNTVKIGSYEQSKVWDGFRVAKRASVISLKEDKNKIEATHNGYNELGLLHTRKFFPETSAITIKDVISKETEQEQVAFFHFHPDVKNIQIDRTEVHLPNENIYIKFDKEILKIEAENYDYAFGFNKREKAKKIKVYFNTTLSTIINL